MSSEDVMKKRAVALVALIALAVPVHAATNLDTRAVSRSIVFIYAARPDNKVDKTHPMGTGFLVFVPIQGSTDRGYVLLVTARHIFNPVWSLCSAANPRLVFARVNTTHYDPQKNTEGVAYLPINLVDDRGQPQYIASSDNQVDAVVIPFYAKVYAQAAYDYAPIGLASFGTEDEIRKLTTGDFVASAGLLPGYSGEKRNYPFFKFGHVSSIPSEPVPTSCGADSPLYYEKAWLIGANLVGGNSGSPIFYVPFGPSGAVFGGPNSVMRPILIGVQSSSIVAADVAIMTPIEDVFHIIEDMHLPNADLYRGPARQMPSSQ